MEENFNHWFVLASGIIIGATFWDMWRDWREKRRKRKEGEGRGE